MRAVLARHARRALVRRLASPSWPAHAILTPRVLPSHSQCYARRNARRTFITSLLQKPPRDIRETEYEPGWLEIMIWRSRMLDNLLPPPRNELLKAWHKFMDFKNAQKRPLNDTQALQCRRLFEYLVEPEAKSKQGISWAEVKPVVSALRHPKAPTARQDGTQDRSHADFARSILAWIESEIGKSFEGSGPIWNKIIGMLCNCGAGDEALRLLPEVAKTQRKEWVKAMALSISKNLAAEDQEQELLNLYEFAEKQDLKKAELAAEITQFYASRDRLKETLSWARSLRPSQVLETHIGQDLVHFAMKHGQEKWIRAILQEAAEESNAESVWREIMCCQLLLGDGMEAVQATIPKMTNGKERLEVKISHFNGMLKLALQQRNEKLANEITALAARMGVAPNEYTFLYWMGLKVELGSLEGAKFSFDRLRHSVDAVADPDKLARGEYEQVLNGFLSLCCAQKTPDFPFITEVLAHADDIQARLEPQTVSQLCLRFLENEQFMDVMDLLAVNAFKYSEAERQTVQAAFLSFCLDPNVSTGRAWSSYQVLEQYFPDLELPARVKVMNEFFRRKRADMSVKVFAAMRNHRSPSYKPNEMIYRQCLEGCARNPDLQSTEAIHNWLKTDQNIQPSTSLFTALMLAYNACDRPLVALDFWREITMCREGPGYASLAAVFWALEKRPDGAKMAREIWKRIENMDIEVPSYVYDSYAGAVAGSGHVVEVERIIANMASYVGSQPDAMTLGIAYNALPARDMQIEFEEWAKGKYKLQWVELNKLGRRMNEFSLCQFKLQRPLRS